MTLSLSRRDHLMRRTIPPVAGALTGARSSTCLKLSGSISSSLCYWQEPRKQKFYRVLTLVMSYSSLGDRRLMGFDKTSKLSFINSKIIFYFGPWVIVSQLIYLYVNYSDLNFDILGIIFSIFPASLLSNVSYLLTLEWARYDHFAALTNNTLKSYKRLIKSLFTEIHLYTVYKDNKTEFVKRILLKSERYTRWTTYYLAFFFIISWIGWISITAVNNYNNKELVANRTARLQTCVFLWLPLDYSYDFRNWCVIHAINIHIVWCAVTLMATFQSLSNIFIFNIIGHIQILKNMMRTDFNEDLSDEEVHKRLVKIIKYYSFITRVFKEVQNAFGFNVMANYAQNLFGNSIVLYQLMYGGRENKMLYTTMIMAYTGGPILMSFVLEEVKKEAEDLPEVVYSMPWEKMSVQNQKTVLLILQRVQSVFEFVALGILTAGVKPMVSILKTTFSYYVMLENTMSVKS
ncbi:uncharacterized protein LOC112052718 [Bicyclus anynana]|uniref:Odorant receptor n=1 Tax=Bicyclus anynana TaxID=110368 RepID=A0ABM3LKF0_BICAN|nr:uncharacterized protein LOC112052718 [Bicyclus anynana]